MKNKQRYNFFEAAGATKTFKVGNRWHVKESTTPVAVCECGVRYLKTRAGQTKCLVKCLSI